MEIIQSINEVENVKDPARPELCWHDGYEVITDKQRIVVLIENGQSCCEQWGYFASLDDLTGFIGAELREIKITDTALNTQMLTISSEDFAVGASECMFVTFETSNGTFQLVAYNAHNGYYGHAAIVRSQQLTHDVML
jgi:hypothetical protein